jgi:NADP-dependent 3-hydroxy acid dehydrogenase YdfG
MRLDFMTKGIRVSQIRPGLVETEFSLVRFKGDAERANKVYQGYTPLKPQDVAEAIRYCLSTPPHVCVNDLEITPMDQPSSHYINKKQ